MKRIVLFIIVVLLILLTGCSELRDWCIFYEDIDGTNPAIYCNDVNDEAYVADYIWDGDLDNTVLNIPEEYDGYIITSLGGFHGSGAPDAFLIWCEEYDIYQEDEVEGEAIEIEFEINLNKNIKEIKKIDLFEYWIKDDVIYHLTYYFNCPEDNEVFYSKDGKLYYKIDDTLAIN